VVGSNATLVLRGEGMTLGGTNQWLMDFSNPDEFDTRGTFVFAPSALATQTLAAFAQECGYQDGALLAATNTGIGTLDLRGLVASNGTMDIVPAGSFGTNAIYAGALRMGGAASPGAFFTASRNSVDRPMHLYFCAGPSDIPRGTYPFRDGQGYLVPVPRLSGGGAIVMFR
jgi:hypothetical protein